MGADCWQLHHPLIPCIMFYEELKIPFKFYLQEDRIEATYKGLPTMGRYKLISPNTNRFLPFQVRAQLFGGATDGTATITVIPLDGSAQIPIAANPFTKYSLTDTTGKK